MARAMTWQAHFADLSQGREKSAAVSAEGLEPEHWAKLDLIFRRYRPLSLPHSSLLQGCELVPLDDDDKEELFACDCGGKACCGPEDGTCECVGDHGNFYVPWKAGKGRDKVLLLDALPSLHPLRECTVLCRCGAGGLDPGSCQDAVVSAGLRLPLVVRPAGDKDLGLFSTTLIPRGSFVCEYAGELISDDEARSRWSHYAEQRIGNYILCLRESSQLQDAFAEEETVDEGSDSQGFTRSPPPALLRTNIDPTRIGNLARFINHSCQPNLVILPVRCDAPWKVVKSWRSGVDDDGGSGPRLVAAPPRAALFALCDIGPDQELSFDYAQPDLGGTNAGTTLEHVSPDLTAPGTERTPCKCGAPTCRRWLHFDADL